MISTILIDGMRSVHCVRAVYTSLGGVDGIDRADVAMGRAVVEHPSPLDERAVAEAVALVGYTLRAIVRDPRRLPLHDADPTQSGGTT